MLVRPLRAGGTQAPQVRARVPRHRAEPARRRPSWDVARARGAAVTVAGGSVWVLLSVAIAVAVVGGMFAPVSPAGEVASAMMRSTLADAELPAPPVGSGHGRRVVFDQSAQRVWLVGTGGEVQRSYLVSGSIQDNVQPGSYRVKSRARYARASVGRGTFEFFVRFTQGRNAPIGFHSVTVNRHGQLVLAREELGTPRTPGCVEQWREDAEALWDFAPIGTPVIVTT